MSEERRCLHCGLPVPSETTPWTREGFCCPGCRCVHGILRAGGLVKYYALRDGVGVPVGDVGAGRIRNARVRARHSCPPR